MSTRSDAVEANAPDVLRALRESEARLQQIVDRTPALVFAKDRDGRYLFVNREFEQIAERAASEIVGRTDREVFPPELATRFRHNDLQVLMEGRSIEFEETGIFAGVQRTFLAVKFPLLDADEVPYAVCGMATDITERKRLEEALSSAALAVSTSEGEPLFSELARYLATILDVDGAFIAERRDHGDCKLHMLAFYLDGAVRERFDYELAGTPCETVLGQQVRIYPSGVPRQFPKDVDFQRLGIESYAGFPLNDSSGRPLGVISVVSRRPLDRSAFIEAVLKIFAVRASAELERMHASEVLRASEASYREIFEASEEAIFVHDWDTGAIVDANAKACEAYGYTHEEMLRADVHDLSSGIPPYTGEEAAKFIERAKLHGTARGEWHRKNKDGSLHWDEVHLKSVRIGGIPRILCFTREITERKEAEQRRARLEAQLRQAQRMEAIGQLTGGIAHDFNNLLTSIMGYVVLASERQAGLGDSRLASYLEQAHLSCERARNLIRQMLLFSRGQKGTARPVSLPPLIRQSLTLLRTTLPATLEMETEIDTDVSAVRLDPVHLDQVLLNLCINARDAVDGSGKIVIGVRDAPVADSVCTSCRKSVNGAFVELRVTDDGPGIPTDVLDRMFEPFFSTKQAGKGTGMGLAIIHGIVHEQGGHVIVESAAGRGSSFRVLFPALLRSDTPEPVALPPGSQLSTPSPILRGSALIVDDEQAVGEFMRELLETWGLRATFVSSPLVALDLVARTSEGFDVVITDQTMPRMTGMALAYALHAIRDDLPILLYTGFDEGIDSDEIRKAGIRALLHKPVDVQVLARTLRDCLSVASAAKREVAES